MTKALLSLIEYLPPAGAAFENRVAWSRAFEAVLDLNYPESAEHDPNTFQVNLWCPDEFEEGDEKPLEIDEAGFLGEEQEQPEEPATECEKPEPKNPNLPEPWSPAEDQVLWDAIKEGRGPSTFYKHLPNRTEAAAKTRFYDFKRKWEAEQPAKPTDAEEVAEEQDADEPVREHGDDGDGSAHEKWWAELVELFPGASAVNARLNSVKSGDWSPGIDAELFDLLMHGSSALDVATVLELNQEAVAKRFRMLAAGGNFDEQVKTLKVLKHRLTMPAN